MRIAIGVIALLIGMWAAGSLGWKLFTRRTELMWPVWQTLLVLGFSAVALYVGVHLIFGAPTRSEAGQGWDSESID